MKSIELKNIIREEVRKVLKEKAASQAQQQAAGIALSYKRGELPASKLRDAGKAMAKMSEKELEKIAGTKHKELPKKVEKKKEMSESAYALDAALSLPEFLTGVGLAVGAAVVAYREAFGEKMSPADVKSGAMTAALDSKTPEEKQSFFSKLFK